MVRDNERSASITISTAHKAKGREWDTVRLYGDFPHVDNMSDEELRLVYVAVTRARKHLDDDTVARMLRVWSETLEWSGVYAEQGLRWHLQAVDPDDVVAAAE